MALRPHHIRYPVEGYDPDATRIERFVSCTVCGFAGIDLERWTDSLDVAPISFETDAETGRTVTSVPAFAACPFCHSPNFNGGSAPDLRW